MPDNKRNFVKAAVIPLLLFGASPGFASNSVRSVSRMKSHRAVVQSTKELQGDTGVKSAEKPVLTNPFAAFNTPSNMPERNMGDDELDVVAYLKKNGLLSSQVAKKAQTSGNLEYRKDFAGICAGSTCTWGGGFCFTNASCPDPPAVPAITSATFDASTGALVVTGTNFSATGGATNDVDVSDLSITGEAGSYTLSAADVEITSATEFTVTLNATDLMNARGLLDKDGTVSTGSTTYNLAGAAGFITASAGTADTTSNGITVSNVQPPTITSAAYDANTGVLSVTGTNMVKQVGVTNDIDISTLTIIGEGSSTYTLTSATDVEITSATAFSVTIAGTDKNIVNQILNKDGTTSTSSTTYNLAAADNWNGPVTDGNIADLTSNGITVSNVQTPAITSATYNAATAVLAVTGTGFLKKDGATNDIDISKLSITGESGTSYPITSATDVEITSGTAFSVTLAGTDKDGVNQIVNKDGTSSTSGFTYNLAAAEDWAVGADAAVNVVDATGNGITASNVAAPTIISATYDASTGTLVITGTGFLKKDGATNDIVANKFTLTGEGGSTYILTDTANVEITSGTAFTLTLSSTDRAAVNQIINKDGTASTSNTTYNLAAAEDWAAGADASVNVVDAAGNGITVSNVAVPTIASAAYNYNTNQLVITGTNFLKRSGATNDIDISMLTFTGEGGGIYTITSATDVEIDSASQFTITLSGADIPNVETLLNADGLTAAGGTTYNLAAAEDWSVGADAAVNVVDLTGNGITVSNYTAPAITSATYNISNGQMVVIGTNLVNLSGATNDVDASLFTVTGTGGSTYTLTDTPDVDITSSTQFTLTLSTTDKLNAHGLLNKNGTQADDNTGYNLAGAEDWIAGSPAAVNVADTTGNAVTVSNVATPTVTSATYDSDTGVLQVTGTNMFKRVGANNDIDISTLSFIGQGGGGAAYTLTTATDVEITSTTQFTATLSGADKTEIDNRLNQMGTTAIDTTTYNLAAADNWLTAADSATDISDAINAITVSIAPQITSATYNAGTGALVITGTNIQANGGGNDIDASLFAFTGEGGDTYTLIDTSDVNRTSVTEFTLSLSATDRAAVNLITNKDGTSSTSGTTYNIAAADDWCTNVTAGDTSDSTGNPITASNVATPTITSATYDGTTGSLVVTGSNLLKYAGATNDIDASLFTFTGDAGATYTLTNTADVEITSGTAFALTLSSTDKAEVNLIVNKVGTSSVDTTLYNLAAAEDWAAGADPAVNVADTTGNGITASNVFATRTIGNLNDSGAGSLRSAIIAASADDTLDLSALSGTITLTSGELSINKNLTITGPTAASLTISGNSASRVFNITGGTVDITNVTISDGSVADNGAGILNAGTLTLSNSTITNNASSGANNGGGIYNDGGTMTVTNSTVNANSADNGGGIYSTGTLTLSNCTFSDNAATTTGGGLNNTGTLHLKNTIIANSTGADCVNSGTISTNTNTLIEDNSCTPALSGDPGLDALADNGGPTWTHGLQVASSAIDAGDNATCEATDQRGNSRPVDGDFDTTPTCDIGAFEFTPGSVQFSNASYTAAENAGNATITVNRSGSTDGAVSVDYATASGTATSGSDFTAAAGSLNWAAGDSTAKTFTVTITNDSDVESDETVNLSLSNFTGVEEGAQATAELSITNDDSGGGGGGGSPVVPDVPDDSDDNDGVGTSEEQGPTGDDSSYDGNDDGVADWTQNNVTSLPTWDETAYVTLSVPSGTTLTDVSPVEPPVLLDEEITFPFGLFSFTSESSASSETADFDVTINLPIGQQAGSYYKFGPTPDEPTDHWYEFLYDGRTGAEINGNTIILHFVDGERGDDDLIVNGLVVDDGGPVVIKSSLHFHIGDTDNWQTNIDLVNVESYDLNYQLTYYGDDGSTLSSSSQTVTAKSSQTVSSYPAGVASAHLQCDEGRIKGITTFRLNNAGCDSIPASGRPGKSLIIPHLAANSSWWTGMSFVNSEDEEAEVDVFFNNGMMHSFFLPGRGRHSFTLSSLGSSFTEALSATVRADKNISGLEIFGNKGTLADFVSTRIDGLGKKNLYLPIMEGQSDAWTGAAVHNNLNNSVNLTLTETVNEHSESHDFGEILSKEALSFSVNDSLAATEGWINMTSSYSHSLFGQASGLLSGMGGYFTPAGSGGYLLPEEGFSRGMAKIKDEDDILMLINPGDETVTVSYVAYNSQGGTVGSGELSLLVHGNYQGTITELLAESDLETAFLELSVTGEIYGNIVSTSDTCLSVLPVQGY